MKLGTILSLIVEVISESIFFYHRTARLPIALIASICAQYFVEGESLVPHSGRRRRRRRSLACVVRFAIKINALG